MIRAHFLRKELAMMLERKPARHFKRGPEFVLRTRRHGIGGAQDDMARERVALRHVIESRVDPFRPDFPRDQGTVREVCGEERLSDAPNRSGFEHARYARHDRFDRHPGTARDFFEWFANKALYLVLGDSEDFRVDWIVVFDRQHRS